MSLGQRFRAAVQKKGWTLGDLSAKTAVSMADLMAIAYDAYPEILTNKLRKICEILKVDPYELAYGKLENLPSLESSVNTYREFVETKRVLAHRAKLEVKKEGMELKKKLRMMAGLPTRPSYPVATIEREIKSAISKLRRILKQERLAKAIKELQESQGTIEQIAKRNMLKSQYLGNQYRKAGLPSRGGQGRPKFLHPPDHYLEIINLRLKGETDEAIAKAVNRSKWRVGEMLTKALARGWIP